MNLKNDSNWWVMEIWINRGLIIQKELEELAYVIEALYLNETIVLARSNEKPLWLPYYNASQLVNEFGGSGVVIALSDLPKYKAELRERQIDSILNN